MMSGVRKEKKVDAFLWPSRKSSRPVHFVVGTRASVERRACT